jgi:alkaline phosphatase
MKLQLQFLSFILICSLGINVFAISPVVSQVDSPVSIILMIGDGMGPNQVEFGRLIEYGVDGNSSILDLPDRTRISTNNIDGITTDSAASATAIATGVKTSNGRISMNWDASMNLTTILEIAEDNEYNTGIVVTCYLTHATPAAFMAHNRDRDNSLEIGRDIAGAGVEVLLGGGSGEAYMGNYIEMMENAGYTYIQNKTQMDQVAELPVIGLFASGNLPKEADRDFDIVPSLSERVEKAISLLDAQNEPFFLMVEGSQIDYAGHANDKLYLAHEVIEFEKAVRVAKTYAELVGNVQLIVTADHETGGFKINSHTLNAPLPLPSDDIGTLRSKREARANEISVSWSSGGHTSSEVYLIGYGPQSAKIAAAEHHIDTFSLMRELIDQKTDPVGSGYYNGHVNVLWYYIGGSLMGIVLIVVTTRAIIFKRRKMASSK